MSRNETIYFVGGQPPSSVHPGKPRRFAVHTVIATALVSVCCILTSAQSIAVKTTEDLPAGAMQQKAATACTECHEARIILQQRLSKAAWTKEVDKMIKWGALVDTSDHDALIDYLSTNFGVDHPPYQAPRSAASKKVLSK